MIVFQNTGVWLWFFFIWKPAKWCRHFKRWSCLGSHGAGSFNVQNMWMTAWIGFLLGEDWRDQSSHEPDVNSSGSTNVSIIIFQREQFPICNNSELFSLMIFHRELIFFLPSCKPYPSTHTPSQKEKVQRAYVYFLESSIPYSLNLCRKLM
jgi:hypothetical protein